jgi:5-methylcytosine-specific restriction endonuclease McrA
MRTVIPKTMRQKVLNRFGGLCGYCGVQAKLQIDHIRAVAHGGSNELCNLMPACHACNNLKMTHNLESFRLEILSQVQRCERYSVNFRTARRYNFLTIHVPTPFLFFFEMANLKGK